MVGRMAEGHFCSGLLVIVVIALALFSVATASDRHGASLSNIVPQAEDMDRITGAEEGWTRDFFGITEIEDGCQAFLSNMVRGNDVPIYVTFWVWSMAERMRAAQKFDELAASDQNLINGT